MQVFFVALVSGACVYEETLSEPITFRTYYMNASETICLRGISPNTAVLFKRVLRSSIQAQYSINGTSVALSGTNLTIGFDSGPYASSLTLTATESGKLSFFAVTFPADCDRRIVSSKKMGVYVRTGTTDKFCYFNGAHKTTSYDIQFSSKSNGRLVSSELGIDLTGIWNHRIEGVNASLITWEGEVDFVAVGVHGGWMHHHDGILRELNSTSPALIELVPQDGQQGHGHHGHREKDRHRPRKDDGDDADDVSGHCHVFVMHILGVALLYFFIVKVICCCKRKSAQEHQRVDQEVSPIEPDENHGLHVEQPVQGYPIAYYPHWPYWWAPALPVQQQ
jgi:hypothetical protein